MEAEGDRLECQNGKDKMGRVDKEDSEVQAEVVVDLGCERIVLVEEGLGMGTTQSEGEETIFRIDQDETVLGISTLDTPRAMDPSTQSRHSVCVHQATQFRQIDHNDPSKSDRALRKMARKASCRVTTGLTPRQKRKEEIDGGEVKLLGRR